MRAFLYLWRSGAPRQLWCSGSLLPRLLLLESRGSRVSGFSSRCSQALEHSLNRPGAWTQMLCATGSSQTRYQTHAPALAGGLYHRATGESPDPIFILMITKQFSGSSSLSTLPGNPQYSLMYVCTYLSIYLSSVRHS